ncbi:arsenite methyltransferase isoform X2 [Rhinatrema bivittatum]|uniref:arsenite methyltransferase isoform X2 n=1 Tax=Rhinatrema bivittatum TaxID=194408 RepID=UPI00112AB1AF|nr:arsenite methyltransferase isoform X2 [Rhinatrema bivittatum]
MRVASSLWSDRHVAVLRASQDYYGVILKKSEDLKTNACVTPASPLPSFIRDALKDVHKEIASRYYGCGLVVPECLENSWILDLGCGSGRDCYMLSKLVGEKGHVTGIDMTDEQIEVAEKYIGYHMQKFGFQQPNVDFVHGYIEKLGDAGLKDNTYDIIISNCVVNLAPDKKTVLEEAYRVLKDGGEMYFSDVYANVDLPDEVRKHQVLWAECLGGAIWWKDLVKIAKEVGFSIRLVSARLVTVNNVELESILGDHRFVSATFRLFKIRNSSTKGKYQAIYNGGITGHKEELHFDANFTFKEGEVVEVDEETASILKKSRFAEEFLIRPVKKDLSATSGGCCSKVKEIIIDPFILVEKLKAKNPTPSPEDCCGARGCC